jgi:hypothetical protein
MVKVNGADFGAFWLELRGCGRAVLGVFAYCIIGSDDRPPHGRIA